MNAPLHLPPAKRDHRETRENYARVVVRNGRYRVAVCEDGTQWLLQRQPGHFPPGGAAGDTIAYCRTRRAIVRLYRALIGMDAAELAGLPKRNTTGGNAK